jgi:FkbM family methyltransferase
MDNGRSRLRGRDRLIDLVVTQFRPIQFRGKAMLAELVLPKTGERDALLFGSHFSLGLSDYMQRHMYAGSFERDESKVVHQMLRPGMTFVDVGANVGYYTALASRLVGPTGSVFAFDPSDYAFSRLTKMIELSGLTNVRALKCGLADSPGERFLFGAIDDDLCDLHTATMVPQDNPQRKSVPTDTLDNVAEQLKIKQIDFMKIDVDGFEPLVLKGATGLIAQGRISHILFECAEWWFNRMNTSTVEIVEDLRSRGFRKLTRIGKSTYFASL